MILLHTRRGVFYAHVFLTQNDREIGVVLRRKSGDGQIVAYETFTPQTSRRLKTDCLIWLRRRQLDDKGRLDLINELETVFEMFDAIRTNGPDISNGWPGSPSTRRLPEPHETLVN
ncbi:hypothetical protein HY626_03340 [Candidatus Uhrbacteria bacterium]|nr:hypothetical protein [Candidatus Uhrbacteria bacterium]